MSIRGPLRQMALLLTRYCAPAVFAFALLEGLVLTGTASAQTPQDSLQAELEAARA